MISTRSSEVAPSSPASLIDTLFVSPDPPDHLIRYRSFPLPPMSWSLPPPPSNVSLPSEPFRTFAPTLPINVLSTRLPVPLIDALPVRVRFSMLADSTRATDENTVSVPSPAYSVTTSPDEST